MANSRIMLTCKHCGEQIVIGKGDLGSYFTRNEKMYEQLNKAYKLMYNKNLDKTLIEYALWFLFG